MGRTLPVYLKYFPLSSFLESLFFVSFLYTFGKYHRFIDKPIFFSAKLRRRKPRKIREIESQEGREMDPDPERQG